jgi:ubiquinone/menaquinone biosynthesis C-methylase UbiE
MIQPVPKHPNRFSVVFPPSSGGRGVADWNRFEADKIPSSLELHPEIEPLLKPESRILDLGCGFGKTVFELFCRGFRHITGVDSHTAAIQSAHQKAQLIEEPPRPTFINAQAHQLPFRDSSFDVVVTQAFWTAIPDGDRPAVMQEVARVLKPDGPLYFSDFQQTWENPIYAERYLKGTDKGHQTGTFEVLTPAGELEYLAHHFTEDEVSQLMQQAGLKAPETMRSPEVKTRSGNTITGIVAVARNNKKPDPRAN